MGSYSNLSAVVSIIELKELWDHFNTNQGSVEECTLQSAQGTVQYCIHTVNKAKLVCTIFSGLNPTYNRCKQANTMLIHMFWS